MSNLRKNKSNIESNNSSEIQNYYLLPFTFFKDESSEIIINIVGDFIRVNQGTVLQIVEKKIISTNILYQELISKFIISESKIPDLIDVISTRYRTKKSFLNDFTSLHIFVLTLRCNQSCIYCQVSQKSQNNFNYDIVDQTLYYSIDFMFKSPSKHLTIEFQGGEPLLVFDKIILAVNKIKEINLKENRIIQFVLCTNLNSITIEQLKFCKENNILISTSLDGPEVIHNKNRIFVKGNSYDSTIKGLNLCRNYLGQDNISALLTVSKYSLDYAKEIVDEYIKNGFRSIFVRAINPFGSALRNKDFINYNTDIFNSFYKTTLDYIIELNKNGVFFVEEYAAIILKKILTPFNSGYTDLQSPNGIINSVLVYNYDGNIYPSDESRMLAEQGDNYFCLGNVNINSYEQIIFSNKTKELTTAWSNESLPGCSECAFQVFCGADPIRNYSTQGNMIGLRATNNFCKKNMFIIKYLFSLMSNDKKIEKIFRQWVCN